MNELKQAGAVITEQEKLNYRLKSLPQNYSHIGDLIDVLPEKDRTVDYLKSKIKLKKAEEESNETSHDSSNAFLAETKTASHTHCYNCGKPGHFQKDCRTRTVIHKEVEVADILEVEDVDILSVEDEIHIIQETFMDEEIIIMSDPGLMIGQEMF
ncbi:hypothetical protein EVAR_87483_1 [Eumeta japonica]|uniref:CCHC-type domain-containing protein n=1 Tax=Eumeta variegata TaxID=151549 RepID=A0A4C1VWE2_EUMVA|nr:hypothetical protein EVAR_87483_1 [Eumeta japonica]